MSKKRKYVKPQHSSATLIYLRLIKDFARPYWFKLLIGVLSGLIIGGAMGAVLRLMDLGLNAFELGVSAETLQCKARSILRRKARRHRP